MFSVYALVRKVEGSGEFNLKMKGVKPKNVVGFLHGKSNPFFEISKKSDSGGSLSWYVFTLAKNGFLSFPF